MIMFLRFSKGPKSANNVAASTHHNEPVQYFLKAVFLGDSVIMEYGDNIVGIAKLHEETAKCMDYDVVVAGKCVLGAERIARSIKDMIGKSNKFSATPTTKRRKYYVQKIECEVLPIKAKIVFTK
jgi:hypothetical protein